jgi:hypothetical protein
MPYPKSRSSLRIGVVKRRSRVPEVRSRSIAMLVTRNITMKGKIPSMIRAIRLNAAGLSAYMK